MATLIAPENDVPATAAPRRPRLRLQRGGTAMRTVELGEGRCAIGSSPRCQICLPAADAQPLQCLVSLEAGVATVTRWAAGVLLNGGDFSKQPFRAGYRLSIGAWELALEAGDGVTLPKAALRETVDFAPAAPVKDLPTVRPAAKTVLTSSRLTDPFAGLLGPAKPVAAEPVAVKPVAVPPVAAPDSVASQSSTAPQAMTVTGTSHLFEDRLVVSLWSANFAARQRAKALAGAARLARGRVGELTLAIAARERDAATAKTTGEATAATLAAQVESLRAELKGAVDQRDQLAAELEALRTAPAKTLPPDPRLQTLATARAAAEREAADLQSRLSDAEQLIDKLRTQSAEAEASHASALETARAQAAATAHAGTDAANIAAEPAEWQRERDAWNDERKRADDEAARLRDQLYACESQVEILRAQVAEADSSRAALEQELATLQRQQNQWLGECKLLEQTRAADLSAVTGQRDELQRRLDELVEQTVGVETASPAPPAVAWQEPEVEDQGPADVAKLEAVDATSADPWRQWESTADAAEEFVEPTAAEPAAAWRATIEETTQRPAVVDNFTQETPQAASLTLPTPEADDSNSSPEAAEKPFEPPSFIDKYRHLLEGSGDEESPRRSRPILDEEHLSPRAAPMQPTEDDSDEALEAYMSSMMRRVRGDGPAPEARPVASQAAEWRPAPALADEEPVDEPPVEEPAIEVDANGMLRLVRRQGPSADMAALRELANSSARTAIAHHRKQRHVESMLARAAVCGIASGASTYLMLTAPSIDSPWFWGGCAALLLALGAGAQLAITVGQRMVDRRRHAAPSRPFAATQTIDLDALRKSAPRTNG